MWIRSNNSIKQPSRAQFIYYTSLIACSQMIFIQTDGILLSVDE